MIAYPLNTNALLYNKVKNAELESPKLTKFPKAPTQDLSDSSELIATTEFVHNAVKHLNNNGISESVLKEYVKKEELEEQLKLKADKSLLKDYATKDWVEDQHYLTEHQSLENYPTRQEVSEQIKGIDFTGYATEGFVEELFGEIKEISQDELNEIFD